VRGTSSSSESIGLLMTAFFISSFYFVIYLLCLVYFVSFYIAFYGTFEDAFYNLVYITD
jgi:hypothetical protein